MARTKRYNKAVLNTTVDKNVKNAFKNSCDMLGCPMGIVLEAFMAQFAAGEFNIKIGKNNVGVDLVE